MRNADRPRGVLRVQIGEKVLERLATWEKVLERLATSDKTTIIIERQPDGKMRVTSASWDGEKVFLKDQVVETRNVDGVSARSQNSAPGPVGPADRTP
jgi:hypothetical protein